MGPAWYEMSNGRVCMASEWMQLCYSPFAPVRKAMGLYGKAILMLGAWPPWL